MTQQQQPEREPVPEVGCLGYTVFCGIALLLLFIVVFFPGF